MVEQYKNRQQIRNYVLRKLGACNVKVELSSEQVDDAINDSLDLFNNYLCKLDPRILKNQTGSIVIQLGEEDRGVCLVKMMIPADWREFAQINIFEILYRMVFPRLPLGDWYMLKSYFEMFQRVRGTDPDWYEDEARNVLYFDAHAGPYDIFYVVSMDLSIEDIMRTKRAYSRDFRKLAVAEAKITLSRIRGKYANSIPVPGGTLTLDADALRTEGLTEKAEVEVKLEQIARFTESPVIWG